RAGRKSVPATQSTASQTSCAQPPRRRPRPGRRVTYRLSFPADVFDTYKQLLDTARQDLAVCLVDAQEDPIGHSEPYGEDDGIIRTGDDTMYGGLGDDILDGGSEFDEAYGQAGNDTCPNSEVRVSCD
ncbi:hypothetical protein AB0C77_35795, partial [Streptomyces sp. NPDC048629]